MSSGLFCFGRQMGRQITSFLVFRDASQSSSEETLVFSVCIHISFKDSCRVAWGSAGHDRNMLVKHNLLDSFRVSGLVLVGFVSGLTKGVL